MIGWGSLIGILAWGAYAQGVLHGPGEGIAFCGLLFARGSQSTRLHGHQRSGTSPALTNVLTVRPTLCSNTDPSHTRARPN